jgi:hypothetical protein
MTVSLVISLPNMSYIHLIYVFITNPTQTVLNKKRCGQRLTALPTLTPSALASPKNTLFVDNVKLLCGLYGQRKTAHCPP